MASRIARDAISLPGNETLISVVPVSCLKTLAPAADWLIHFQDMVTEPGEEKVQELFEIHLLIIRIFPEVPIFQALEK